MRSGRDLLDHRRPASCVAGLDLKLVNGIGLFAKSTDWESQIGLLLTLRD